MKLTIEEINEECKKEGFEGCTKDRVCIRDGKPCDGFWIGTAECLCCHNMT